MVGVITSSRCDHCRKRKKKCDEKRPACTRCIQAGLICSGFITRWKFVDEAARVAGQYVGRQFVFDTVDEGLESIFEKYEDEKFQTDGTLQATLLKGSIVDSAVSRVQ
ncbi:putative Uncharacterized transcriptional regulatory protein [Glarea lozoyensis 74030]|uniref:Putative Uncharacterized transcriptional regulatory protein n=1 Tax=Glarea lozoyensis (strain ATCC 74030 / MF5533) TaxID=1104152 RepID=H0EWC0_GLAL7|nr:putative Uncharacterized transcriptional regulatory protein [Glarea lozoyensis 74030]